MATISFEALHLYASSRTFDKDLKSGAALAARWRKALDARFFGVTDLRIATKVFIDDYSDADETDAQDVKTRAEVNKAVISEFEMAGLPVDYIVYEGDCALTAEYARKWLVPAPKKTEGSFSPAARFDRDDINGRLEFDYVSPDFDPDTDDAKARGIKPGTRFFRNDVGIGISIGRSISAGGGKSAIRWSCPTVAAWWQLIRFGVLIEVDEVNADGAPVNGWKRNHENCPDFVADRTITLLSPVYIGVEHAVRTILSNIASENYARIERRIRSKDKNSKETILNRISYIFDE